MKMNLSSPWIKGWIYPKQAIRAVIQTNPKQGLWMLAFIGALSASFQFSHAHSIGVQPKPLLFFSIFFSVLFCFYAFMLQFNGLILKATGALLGGKSDFQSLRAVAIWSSLPNLVFVFAWTFMTIFQPETVLILNATHRMSVFLNLFGWITGIWQMCLLFQMIREVQGFSLSRSILNVVLFYLLFFSFIIITLIAIGSVNLLIFNFIK